jgi:TetR/AcrR family transcriptional regulator, fatty acid metabolism regulator protein
LTERSVSGRAPDRRRALLDAAVRVFASKGYHTCRVGEIAREAGVAHGLLYHYFSSKEEVLETILRESWAEVLETVGEVERSGAPAGEQLRQVAAFLLRSWRRQPDLVRLLVRELARSPELQNRIELVDEAFAAIARIVARGQAAGELRADVEPRLASFVFYGAIDELLTGWVLGRLPSGETDVARAEQAVTAILGAGLAREPVGAA